MRKNSFLSQNKKRSATSRWAQCALAGVLFLLAPAVAPAVELDGTSSTYLISRKALDDSNLLPLYEYLNMSVRDLGRESVSFQFGGWLRYDLRDDSTNKNTNNDLQYAYLSYRDAEANAMINAGRIMVFEGVAAERVDGLSARTDLRDGFGVSAFGGTPVETNAADLGGNNTIYGGRFSHTMTDLYTIGVSYLKEEKNSAQFREEEGVDLRLKPVNKVELLGKSTYNAEASGWAAHTYNLLLGPFAQLKLNTEVSKIDYQKFFVGATNSAFVFQPGGTADPKEKVSIYGESVSYEFSEKLNASVDYKKYVYDIAGNAGYYGGRVGYSIPKSLATGVSIHRMSGDTDRLSYYEYRVFGMKKFGSTDVTVDLLNVKYDAAVNGVTNAYTAALAAGYELSEKLKLGADLEYSKNPDYDKDVRAFLKLIYQFQNSYGKGKGV